MLWDKYPPRQLYTTIHYRIVLMTGSSLKPIQVSCPNETTLAELISQIIVECKLRGVDHAGQQQYIVREVLKEYAFAN